MRKIHLTPVANRIGYSAMLLAALCLAIFANWTQASIFAGLAFIFDPFDAETAFGQRPLWQRAWTVFHAVAVFVLMGVDWFHA